MKSLIPFFLIIYTILSRGAVKCASASGESGGGGGSGGGGSGGGGSAVNTGSSGTGSTGSQGTGNNQPQGVVAGVTGTQGNATVTTGHAPKVKSFFLKDEKGVKLEGSCGTEIGLFLVPHVYIYAQTKTTNVQIISELIPTTKKIELNKDKFQNECDADGNKKFKLVVFINNDILTLRWIVYEGQQLPREPTGAKLDIKKFRIPTVNVPITSIQVHTWVGSNRSYILESKNYAFGNTMPEKCDNIASNCFLSGYTDIEKCYKCTLVYRKMEPSDVCYKYASSVDAKLLEGGIVTVSNDDNSDEYEFKESVNNILGKMYKTDENNGKVFISVEEMDNNLKEQLLNYCTFLQKMDNTGTLGNNTVGNEVDIYHNLMNMLKNHKNEDQFTLQNKLKNAAVCMKNVDDWVSNRRGLVLPDLSYNMEDNYDTLDVEKNFENNENVNEDMLKEDDNGIIDLTTGGNVTMNPFNFTNNIHCNDEYCDRSKDKNSCISKMVPEDQGDCGISWIFASKLHLETSMCMKGYYPFQSSALYIANCSHIDPKQRCLVGSNPLEFLNIVKENKNLPLEENLPYSHTKVGNECPQKNTNWVNLWGNIELLDAPNDVNALGTKGYTAYESSKFKENMDAFIKIVKNEVKIKGSVIAYVNAENTLGYNLNGKEVQNLCGSETPDHAVNIIGYGNYINNDGEKKSYWIVRNSWGENWGDNGNFKVDMDTPAECKHNFVHTAAVFNLDLPTVKNSANKEPELYNYYLKNSPDFYSNLYYQNFNPEDNLSPVENTTVQGQADAGNSGTDGVTSRGTQVQTQSNTIQTGNGQGTAISHGSGTNTVPTSATSPNIEVVHILKHIKNTKVDMGLVKYEQAYGIGDHSCSRAYSVDPDKHEKCVDFCKQKLTECTNNDIPGICLSQKYEMDDCFFCYV
ncbi:serine-repeat antigen, putative [Plasmodium ovale]|uniref:Serine-repeat antigen, putative n=1 Tax=Plasmodium ovale TaxID=36330 RepID=A0A1D3RDC3_PLAOA|nr:serine-repeat antigen, putative [Plasmodium ovale]